MAVPEDTGAAGSSMAVDKPEGETSKKARDYSSLETDIAGYKELAAKGGLDAALQGLLALERTERLAEDVGGTSRACRALLECCFAAGKWDLLMEHILLLSKRRAQLRGAIQDFVRQAMRYVDQAPDQATQVKLIETLLGVTMGKIFVEIERARLTKRLAGIRESQGDVAGAADLLQEVAVETFGAMHKLEKISYILEQVRLCLDRGDNVRAQILAKKISPGAFKKSTGPEQAFGIEGTRIEPPEEGTPGVEELKIRYYRMMIRYYEAQDDYLEVCRCFRAIYDTDSVQADAGQWQPVLRNICWYLALSPAGVEHNTLLNTTMQDKRMQDLPACRELLRTFTTVEIAPWDAFQSRFAPEMEATPEVFAGPRGTKRREDLRLRVVQHNILVVSKYYTRVTMQRLGQLLALPIAEAERHLADMVNGKAVTVRIDRPKGIVRFGKVQTADDVLNDWGRNIDRVLDVVSKITQDISKEAMQRTRGQAVAAAAGTSAA